MRKVEWFSRLPMELFDMVIEEVGGMSSGVVPFGREEAEGIREGLMEERGMEEDEMEQRMMEATFSFCEH